MTHATFLRATTAVVGLVASGCATTTELPDHDRHDREDEAPVAAPFVVWQQADACLIRHSLAPALKICVTGYGDLDKAREFTKSTLLQWLDAVRDLDDQVTSTIELTCSNPHGSLAVDNSGEYAYAGAVHLRTDSAYGTYLHEFGHAYACLGDTYVSGTAGSCAYGQPHSIMCDGLLRNDLSEDDIAGVRHQFLAMVGGSGEQDVSEKPEPPVVDPSDKDGDGVPNGDDKCSQTPAGSHVWGPGEWYGCASGEYVDNPTGGGSNGDGDADGVADPKDRCPTTPSGKWVWTYQHNGYWQGCAPGEVPSQ